MTYASMFAAYHITQDVFGNTCMAARRPPFCTQNESNLFSRGRFPVVSMTDVTIRFIVPGAGKGYFLRVVSLSSSERGQSSPTCKVRKEGHRDEHLVSVSIGFCITVHICTAPQLLSVPGRIATVTHVSCFPSTTSSVAVLLRAKGNSTQPSHTAPTPHQSPSDGSHTALDLPAARPTTSAQVA